MTRSCSSLWIGRRARHRLAVACLVAVAVGWPGIAVPAAAPKAAASESVPAAVIIKDGRLTVDVRGAGLADVLQQVADAAGFRLTTNGELGVATASFSARSVEEGLRRLTQDHELMMVYRASGAGGGAAKLVEVQVFSSTSRGRAAVAEPEEGQTSRGSVAIDEITELVRARDAERGVPRLSELLASPDSVVRGRAVWGLSILGGPAVTSALTGALRDEEPFVRGQAAQALRRAAGAEAVPALSSLLGSDPDASVRRAAARALSTLRTPQADAALSLAADDLDDMVRAEGKSALDRQNAR